MGRPRLCVLFFFVLLPSAALYMFMSEDDGNASSTGRGAAAKQIISEAYARLASTVSPPPILKPKWLLYYTIGGANLTYIELLRFQLSTLRSFSENDDVKMVVLADRNFSLHARKTLPLGVSIIHYDDPKMAHSCAAATPSECRKIYASMRKTKPFDLIPNITQYDAVLYLDADMVVAGSLLPIFETIAKVPGKLHVKDALDGGSSEAVHSSPLWGNGDYTPQELSMLASYDVRVFGTGQFGFVPDGEMRYHFSALNNAIIAHGNKPHHFEQSHMNRYFNPRLLTINDLETFVGYANADIEWAPLIHHKSPHLKYFYKLDNMKKTWVAVLKRGQFGGDAFGSSFSSYIPEWLTNIAGGLVQSSRFSLHTVISAKKIIEFGVPDMRFIGYLLDSLQPKAFWVVDSRSRHRLYSRLLKVTGKNLTLPSSRSQLRIIGPQRAKLIQRYWANVLGRVDMIYFNLDSPLPFSDVSEALRAGKRMLRPGTGFLAGQGYNCSESDVETRRKAVEEFCEAHGHRVWYTFSDACSSFVIRV